MVGDATWKVLLVVCHHDESLVLASAESVDDFLNHLATLLVKTVKWLIEDEKLRILDEGTSKENHTLLSA